MVNRGWTVLNQAASMLDGLHVGLAFYHREFFGLAISLDISKFCSPRSTAFATGLFSFKLAYEFRHFLGKAQI